MTDHYNEMHCNGKKSHIYDIEVVFDIQICTEVIAQPRQSGNVNIGCSNNESKQTLLLFSIKL